MYHTPIRAPQTRRREPRPEDMVTFASGWTLLDISDVADKHLVEVRIEGKWARLFPRLCARTVSAHRAIPARLLNTPL